jgi:Ca2+/H+ antiporter, TMEM165/GDT1 family
VNLEKVVFGFFILLALTLNFGFVLGDIDNPEHHHAYELYAAIIVSLIATVLKFGDRSHLGAVLLATSLVADLQLLMAAFVWAMATQVQGLADVDIISSVVSLAGGALLANLASAVLLIIETAALRR